MLAVNVQSLEELEFYCLAFYSWLLLTLFIILLNVYLFCDVQENNVEVLDRRMVEADI